jgi:Peptidase C39 family
MCQGELLMSELTAVDYDGKVHYLWLQEEAFTCGPSCVYMMECLVGQSCSVNGEARVKEILAFYRDWDDHSGTHVNSIAGALTRLGYPAAYWKSNDVATLVRNTNRPFVAHVEWPNGKGHFVVISERLSAERVAVLDPAYGLEQPSIADLPAYTITRNYRDPDKSVMHELKTALLGTGIGGKFTGWVATLK